jgi:hypothetical protein
VLTANIPDFPLTSMPSISSDIQHFLNPLTITSGEIRFHGLDLLAQQSYTGLPYCPNGVRTYSPTKSHSEYNSFKWSLKGVFRRMHNNEVIPPGMTTRSIFLARIIDLAYNVRWPSNASLAFSTIFLAFSLQLVHLVTYPLIWH